MYLHTWSQLVILFEEIWRSGLAGAGEPLEGDLEYKDSAFPGCALCFVFVVQAVSSKLPVPANMMPLLCHCALVPLWNCDNNSLSKAAIGHGVLLE